MQSTVTVLDIPIAAITMKQAVAAVEDFITAKKTHLIATANAEMIMMAQQDGELASILKQADLVVPDGAGVVWASRYLGHPVPERVAGYDLSQQLLQQAAQKGYRVYFFGAAPGIAVQAQAVAVARYPGLHIVGVRDGYFSVQEEDEIIAEIKASQSDILLVALGVPKQEKWLAKNLHRLATPVAMGVGGTFDVMAGVVERAPLWMQQASLEWLYRLLQQPQRFLRMLALPQFVLRVLYAKK
mgnify:CR=1 FL=1